jgi:meso-butanediol dehydrogenase/(S,S)-butanediol dehydrogenase/diacetyl reductase
MDLEGKVAVVTGAGNGIGREVARIFAKHGAVVGILDIDYSAAAETERLIESSSGRALAVRTDVGNESSVVEAFRTIRGRYGDVTVLANVAGIELYRAFIDIEDSEWDRNLAVNLKSVYLCCRQAIPGMMRSGGGVIINTSSVQALACGGDISSYATAKGGIISLTQSLARDYGKFSIRVNTICPGCIDTPMQDRALALLPNPQEVLDKLRRTVPLQRTGSPEDIANVALFLASPKSAYVSGVSLLVDGGLMTRLPLPE